MLQTLWLRASLIRGLKVGETSSARSATLGGTSLARLMIKGQVSVCIGSPNTHAKCQKSQSVASSCKLKHIRFSTLLRIQDRTKCGKGTEHQGEGEHHRENKHN